MGNVIKINCKKVFDTGVIYINDSKKIGEIQDRLDSVCSGISSIWKGVDSSSFQSKFCEFVDGLDSLRDFLDNRGVLLKGNALDHGNVDHEFANNMKRKENEHE